MSDDYIYVIPANPDFVPDETRQQLAIAYFRSISLKAEEVIASVSDHITFVHCGGNFEKIHCPSCGAEIEISLWQDWMDEDYKDKHFILNKHSMPCCQTKQTLNDLKYTWPQGFARYKICAMNPNTAKLSEEQRNRFEQIFGCPVKMIYQHI